MIVMRKLVISLTLVLLSSFSFGQSDSSGVYTTAHDFAIRKLTYGCDCKSPNCSISLVTVFPSNKLTVTYEGKKYKLKKTELYGYRTCEKKFYRFFNKSHYQILNTQGIFLYDKTIESGTGMNPEIETFYYFSITHDASILPLTISNLKDAYPKNTKFHDALDSIFKVDADLMEFDKYLKKYKLIHVFEESLK
jgi:hypothetical protein